MRTALILALALTLVAAPAQAWELGYEYRVVDSSLEQQPRNDFEKNTPDGTYFGFDPTRGAIAFSMPMHGLKLVDETGALLGGAQTAANISEARRAALESARRRGARAGDTVTYSYQEAGAAGGLRTSFHVAWGEGKGVRLDAPTVTSGETEYKDAVAKAFLVDMRVPLPAYRGDLVDVDLVMDVLFRSYELTGINPTLKNAKGYRLEERTIAMPFGAQVAVYPLDNLRLRGFAGYDVVFGLISVLASSVAAPIPPSYTLSLDADYRLFGGLSLTAGAELGGSHINFTRAISQRLFRVGASYAF
ncbi:MAG: hypothetical protein ACLGIN_18340 [Candidatus Sericytochromatia bacterium]